MVGVQFADSTSLLLFEVLQIWDETAAGCVFHKVALFLLANTNDLASIGDAGQDRFDLINESILQFIQN